MTGPLRRPRLLRPARFSLVYLGAVLCLLCLTPPRGVTVTELRACLCAVVAALLLLLLVAPTTLPARYHDPRPWPGQPHAGPPCWYRLVRGTRFVWGDSDTDSDPE